MATKDHDGAIADLTRLIELQPNEASHYSSRGDAKSEKKDYSSSVADYSKAIELDRKNIWNYLFRASVKRRMGDESGAAADETAATALDPNSADNWFHVAFSKAFRDGQFESSLTDFDRAVALGSKRPGVFWERGLVYMGLGRLPDALDFRKGLELAGSERSWVDLLQLCIWITRARLGEDPSATNDLLAYLKNRPSTQSDAFFYLQVMRYFTSELTEQQFFKAGEDKHATDALFFAGMSIWRRATRQARRISSSAV